MKGYINKECIAVVHVPTCTAQGRLAFADEPFPARRRPKSTLPKTPTLDSLKAARQRENERRRQAEASQAGGHETDTTTPAAKRGSINGEGPGRVECPEETELLPERWGVSE